MVKAKKTPCADRAGGGIQDVHGIRELRFTAAKTKREAVVKALEAYNRQQRVNDLISSFGTLDFATNDEIQAGDLEEIALREAKGSAS